MADKTGMDKSYKNMEPEHYVASDQDTLDSELRKLQREMAREDKVYADLEEIAHDVLGAYIARRVSTEFIKECFKHQSEHEKKSLLWYFQRELGQSGNGADEDPDFVEPNRNEDTTLNNLAGRIEALSYDLQDVKGRLSQAIGELEELKGRFNYHSHDMTLPLRK